MQKRFFWIYGRQTTTKMAMGDVDTNAKVLHATTGVTGAAPYKGQTGCDADPEEWSIIGEISAGGLKAISGDAFMRAEKGDTLPLSGGDVPVISEKLVSEFLSFDADTTAWSAAANAGAYGAMALRKRLCTLETGVNVDLAFIDPITCTGAATITVNYFMWDVPFHVALDVTAGGTPNLPCSVEKEVSNATDNLDVGTCTIT